MKTFECANCGHLIFFENEQCVHCGAQLGYLPDQRTMAVFAIKPDGTWEPLGIPLARSYQPCRNNVKEHVCNWMVSIEDKNCLCRSCRYTEIIPTLSLPGNAHYWYLLEAAKRRLFYSLDTLGLQIPSRTDDPQNGLTFQFLEDTPTIKVLTGHNSGLVTLNIVEADDAERDARRTSMGEPYRTLLGHFRHEIGHFYWDHLIANGPWLTPFRTIFGDEEQDYQEALRLYYESGTPVDWQLNYISGYASMHPWEDWAESWAHYLHIVDTLETAHCWGARIHVNNQPSTSVSTVGSEMESLTFRSLLINQWLPLTQFLNSMNRSMGQQDMYPFVLPDTVINKLAFIDHLVRSSRNIGFTSWPPPFVS